MGLFLYVLIAILILVPFWKIFEKAGFAPALSLLMIVPFANLVALYLVAFSDWPSQTGGTQAPRHRRD